MEGGLRVSYQMSFKGYKAEYGSKPVEKKNNSCLELDEPVTRGPTSWKGNKFGFISTFPSLTKASPKLTLTPQLKQA